MNKTIIIDEVKYECETHDFNKKLSEIKIPKGWRLWTAEECIKLHNSEYKKKLNLIDCWFYIKQPFNINKEYVAGFLANSVWAGLNCDRGPSYSDLALGVRFARDLK